jgi:uroporphyrinogen-III synthase
VNAGRRVILTRPSHENQTWASGLQAAGYEVLTWPLIDIKPVPRTLELSAALANLSAYQAVMFVSRNAVSHALAIASGFDGRSTRCWVTGPGSRQALTDAGVPATAIDAPDDTVAQYDTEALWRVVQPALQTDKPVLILRGTEANQTHTAVEGVGRDWLMQQLQAAGVKVQTLAVYQRQCPVWSQAQQAQAVEAAFNGSVWLFSSSQAVVNLQKLLPDQNWSAAHALATHARIAQAASDAGFKHVQICKPVLAAMLASLESGHEQ